MGRISFLWVVDFMLMRVTQVFIYFSDVYFKKALMPVSVVVYQQSVRHQKRHRHIEVELQKSQANYGITVIPPVLSNYDRFTNFLITSHFRKEYIP